MPSVISGNFDGSELCRHVNTAGATVGIVANYKFWLNGEWLQRSRMFHNSIREQNG